MYTYVHACVQAIFVHTRIISMLCTYMYKSCHETSLICLQKFLFDFFFSFFLSGEHCHVERCGGNVLRICAFLTGSGAAVCILNNYTCSILYMYVVHLCSAVCSNTCPKSRVATEYLCSKYYAYTRILCMHAKYC